MFKINEAADMLHVNPNALRFMKRRELSHRTGMKIIIECIQWMILQGSR